MTIQKNHCITMHIVDYSLQMTVSIAVQNCALFMYLCVVLWKKPDLLSKDTHTDTHTRIPCLAGADAKDQFTGEAMTWDLMTFVCTTLIRLLHYSFLSCLPEINKYSKVSVKLVWEKLEANQLCFQPTSKSEVVFFFLMQHRILWIWAPTVSLKLRF